MPTSKEMLQIASDVGYSETAFLHKYRKGWRIRYFSPEMEIPFCGHATIATGYVLGEQFEQGDHKLYLNTGSIDISIEESNHKITVSLNSPPTYSEQAPQDFIEKTVEAFNFSLSDINPNFPVKIALAGAKHLIIVLSEHEKLSSMDYDFERVKTLMKQHDLITINLLWQKSSNQFHSRNPFPPGGVYEDPATGAAAAAFAGYLRDVAWSGSNALEIFQGEDMGSPSKLFVEFQNEVGSSVKVSGEARYLNE